MFVFNLKIIFISFFISLIKEKFVWNGPVIGTHWYKYPLNIFRRSFRDSCVMLWMSEYHFRKVVLSFVNNNLWIETSDMKAEWGWKHKTFCVCFECFVLESWLLLYIYMVTSGLLQALYLMSLMYGCDTEQWMWAVQTHVRVWHDHVVYIVAVLLSSYSFVDFVFLVRFCNV